MLHVHTVILGCLWRRLPVTNTDCFTVSTTIAVSAIPGAFGIV